MYNYIVGLLIASFPFAVLLNLVELVIFAFYKFIQGKFFKFGGGY